MPPHDTLGSILPYIIPPILARLAFKRIGEGCMTGGLRLVEAQKVFNREARRGFRLQRFLTLPAVDIPTMLLIKQL